MELTLKSRVGAVEFTRRTRIEHERGTTYEMRTYRFNFDNDFKAKVPSDVWSDLENEWLDRSANLKYKEALIEL